MKLYHGTTVPNLDRLKACSCDRDGNPILYLTDNPVYSLFYIRDREIDFVTCGVGRDGKVHYDEKFPNQLELMYKGKSGYLYETDIPAELTRVPGIWLCREDANVMGMEYIPDVYDAIRDEIQNGNVDFLPYEALTLTQKELNHQGMVHEFLRSGCRNSKRTVLLRKFYPEAWEEAQKFKG